MGRPEPSDAGATRLREPVPTGTAAAAAATGTSAGAMETRLRTPASAPALQRVVRDAERLQHLTRPAAQQQAVPESTHPTASRRSPAPISAGSSTVNTSGYDLPRSARGGSTGKQIAAIVATVVVGTVLGVLLFIQGGDLVGGLFAGERERPRENPAAVTPRPEMPREAEAVAAEVVEPAAPIDDEASMAMWEEVPPAMLTEDAIEQAEPASTPRAVESAAPSPTPTAEPARAAKKRPEVTIIDVERPETAAMPKAARSAAAGMPVAPKVRSVAAEAPEPTVSPISGTRNYTVQVRATTDQAEARRIAQHLESIGMGNVKVVETEKNGQRYFRVRGGSHTSVESALQAARQAGYDDVWVVPQ